MREAWIVASNAKYLPGLTALLNSLDYVQNMVPVIILNYNFPEEYLKEIKSAGYCFEIILDPISQKEVDWLGEAEVLMRKRYTIPLKYNLEGCCIMDADMFVAHNLDRYFEIVRKSDIIMGCGLEQKRRYGDENDQYPAKSGKYLIPPDFWNARDLCCAPLFVGKRWFAALNKSYDMVWDHPHGDGRFLAPEMNAINICLLEAGAHDFIVPFGQAPWTGLHETMMKAHTRAIEMHDQLFTEDGQEINVVHGQYWNKTWRGWQTENQLAMIDREFNGSESYKNRSIGSFELLCNWYKRFATGKVNIEKYLDRIDSRAEAKTLMEIT